jgi:hypothetical protein
MSYRFKGKNIILDGSILKITPVELPETPELHQIVIDITDNKLKMWNGERWLILGDSSDIYFNNNSSSLLSDNVEDAINEIECKTMKRRDIISFSIKGNANNHWMSQNGLSSPTNKTFFTPPYNCRILRIAFSNDHYGEETNPLHCKLIVYEKLYSIAGNITTNNDIAWYITSEEDPNRLNYGENGRTWIYDSSNENDTMLIDHRYAFRLKKLSGNVKPHNATINIYIEEI